MRLRARFVSSLLSLALVGITLLSASAYAQQMPKLPIDSAVRIGKLENGLTYFIRHNALPEGKAEFYIAQRVGSMQEEDSQSGLAHFLEHIAFNGTKNFPGKGIINYLETIGVKFGENINAYTAFDKTVYTLMNVPVARKATIDSCLLILHDWSCAISLEDKEIDAERGVIQEEWRSRNNARQRIGESLIRQAYPNSRYGERMPIGRMEVVRNFKYQELRDYYKKWYRPDLQAIIVVGDINVDEVEASLKRIFADIPKPVNPAVREYLEVADNQEPIIAMGTDPEATSTNISILFKSDATPREMKETNFAIVENYLKYVIAHMLDRRFSQITKKPNAPFLSGGASFGDFLVSPTEQAISFDIEVKEGQYKRGLDALVAEIERARQHGFTQSEYKHASKEYVSILKARNAERDKRKNGTYANIYADYFCDGGNLATPETWYTLGSQIANALPLEAVNATFQQIITDNNNVILFSAPEKEGLKYPTKAEFAAQYLEARKQPVEPYKEQISSEKLMDKLPTKGKIVKEAKNGKFGTTIWTLSNGTEVIIKPTDFKADQISLSAVRPGGLYALNVNKDNKTLRLLNPLANLGGVGAFDVNALDRVLSGRVASASTGIGSTEEYASGSSNQEDLETMLQLLYLHFTAKRKDVEAYEAFKERTISEIKAAEANPLSTIGDTISIALTPKNPFGGSLKEKDFEQVSYDRALELYKQRFSNVRGFKFFIVGNVDLEKLRPLVEQYIASLPSTKKVEKSTEHLLPKSRRGSYMNHYTKPLQTPMGLVVNFLVADMKHDLKNSITVDMLGQILDIVYTASIREEEGGTYGVSTSGSITLAPEQRAQLRIIFQTDPIKAKHLNSLIFKELEDIAKNGVKREHFDKVISSAKESQKTHLKENSYWMNVLRTYFYRNMDTLTDFDATLDALTPEDIRLAAEQLVKSKDRIEVMLLPEAREEKK
ncbi:pitrilysin family protein [Porphyromonas sp. COT-239 OH1446]|uniref:M16 family metallopeptidase n=1 Tax=Porphyromonas sp. COT-239 OH1446 TaxID=1515613 RepID=UPI00052C18A4|nr:M16 family metallopeptidase [Porphyromonas sp. COT-239 OH1446]KGN71492.1 peptidase M16 [Porphyromonas sp. COT-239 OH1446]